MSAMTTFAPARANATAVARPMPLEPPVITTTLFSKEDTFVILSSFLPSHSGIGPCENRPPPSVHTFWVPEPRPGHDALQRGPVHPSHNRRRAQIANQRAMAIASPAHLPCGGSPLNATVCHRRAISYLRGLASGPKRSLQ